jgi:amino acid adenylation domain-containing protein
MKELLQEWVTRRAESQPGATAVVFGQEKMTYAQLDESSSRLARVLKAAGCKRGDRVCFLMPKSPIAIVTILGVLKADCVNVPLDSTGPACRARKILAACETRWILAAGKVTGLLHDILSDERFRRSICVGWLDQQRATDESFTPEFFREDLRGYSAQPVDYQNRSQDPAHILFTSGSTGSPKGVVITHANVMCFVKWATRYFGMQASDRNSGHAPLQFDLSTFDVFGTFAAGAELHLVPAELNLIPHRLVEFIRTAQLTQWFSVPAILTYMAKLDVVRFNDFPALQRILWCGEVFPTPSLIYWMKRLPHVSFTNLYGPTEATIASSYYTVPRCPTDERDSIPIGVACEGEELLVLDAQLKPVGVGQIGELHIAGVGLSPGYWRDQERTDATFIQNPQGPDRSARLYRTGDLARVGPDGLVYFIGRADSQIKSRGYRVELGEVEAALNELAYVRECAVLAIDSEGFEGTLICCAYACSMESRVNAGSLRKALSHMLPAYMLPSRWASFERLPKNSNGKVDRPRLRELFNQQERATPAEALEVTLRANDGIGQKMSGPA